MKTKIQNPVRLSKRHVALSTANLINLCINTFAPRSLSHKIKFALVSGLLSFTTVACAPQAYITLHSEPKGARIYTKDEVCIGTTPCTIKLGELPKQSMESKEWQLGEFIAYKDGYEPVTRALVLDLNATSHSYKNIFQKESLEWEFLFDFNGYHQNGSSPASQDFFACNCWLDQNQNSVISRNEFQGVKDHFRAHEKITFVALLRQDPGVNYSYVLRAPDGSIFKKSRVKKTNFKNAMAHAVFNARDLINNKGVGLWEIQWMVEGNPVAITRVNVTQ